MGYIYLALAIISEVIGTTALKSSEGFTRLGPSLLVVVGYGLAFYLLALVLRTIPMASLTPSGRGWASSLSVCQERSSTNSPWIFRPCSAWGLSWPEWRS